MPKLDEYLSVGFCRSYGDADYAVKCSVADLTYEQMQQLRAIIPVAIFAMERMWSAEQEKKFPAGGVAAKSSLPDASLRHGPQFPIGPCQSGPVSGEGQD